MNDLSVRDFRAGDEAVFRALNKEWITRYFVLEEKDRKTFDDPRKTILGGGGRIFLAVHNDTVVGCCALQWMAPDEYEVVKMAVTAHSQGQGIGKSLLQHTITAAKEMSAARLYLETNHVLAAAIHLYEEIGFRYVPTERLVPTPYQRADVFMEFFCEPLRFSLRRLIDFL